MTTAGETNQLIAKCRNGHIVRGTHSQLAGFSENVKNGCWLMCPCGSFGPVKWMDIRIVETTECSAKCTGATGPACSCSCGGENHGGGKTF